MGKVGTRRSGRDDDDVPRRQHSPAREAVAQAPPQLSGSHRRNFDAHSVEAEKALYLASQRGHAARALDGLVGQQLLKDLEGVLLFVRDLTVRGDQPFDGFDEDESMSRGN